MCVVVSRMCLSHVQHFPYFVQLPLFLNLCKDEAWGVRKACADVYIDVAASCSLSVRHSHLTKTFVQLLDDTSRWVSEGGRDALHLVGEVDDRRALRDAYFCDVYEGVWEHSAC